MTDKHRNIILSIIFLAFGGFLYTQSLGIKQMMQNDVGSGFFPKIVAIAIIAVATLRLIITFFEKNNTGKDPVTDMKGGWSTIVLVGLYIVAFQPVGFIISTAVYLALQMLVLTPKGKRNFILLGAISIGTPLFVYTLFVHVIGTTLPRGLFGF